MEKSILSSRITYSCIRCSDRKVRCDRQTPCSNCVKYNFQCIFRELPPPRKKQKRVNRDSLKGRLKRCEALLQKVGVDLNGLPTTSEAGQRSPGNGSEVPVTEDSLKVPITTSTVSDKERPITTSQLLQSRGRSKYVDK